MGRGRQKAKQQKIARKLKYLTTDTNYDELAKELNAQESDVEIDAAIDIEPAGSVDAVASASVPSATSIANNASDAVRSDGSSTSASSAEDVDTDLDDYAQWAAEAAAKATSGEMPIIKPKPHMPIPSGLLHSAAKPQQGK